MLNIGLIGLGRWGHVYLNTLNNIPDINIIVMGRDYKNKLKEIDAAIIVTPVETHFQIAKDCLLAGKHALVEKPFVTKLSDAADLYHCSENYKLILMVGHIYLHHGGIKKIKEIIDSGILGDIKNIFSQRMSNSNHPNSLWEMGSHDIYILKYFFDKYNSEEMYAMGDKSHCIFHMKYKYGSKFDTFEKGIDAFVEVGNYYYQKNKIREIIIDGTKKRLIFDDEAEIKLKLLDKKTNNIEIISYENIITPLEKQCRHFFDCISNNRKPIVIAQDGYDNIRSLEILEKML